AGTADGVGLNEFKKCENGILPASAADSCEVVFGCVSECCLELVIYHIAAEFKDMIKHPAGSIGKHDHATAGHQTEQSRDDKPAGIFQTMKKCYAPAAGSAIGQIVR